MIDEMGIFRTTIEVAPLGDQANRRVLADVLVDTGSEYNWIPEDVLAELGVAPVRVDRFELADGTIIERSIGFAMIFAAERATPTIVVFAQKGEMALLGAIGLEGMNLRVDLVRRELVPAGPVLAAAAA